ncbi:MAG: hypothetical protein ACO394_15615, partial [Blastocatellia bacterium]
MALGSARDLVALVVVVLGRGGRATLRGRRGPRSGAAAFRRARAAGALAVRQALHALGPPR